MIGFWNGLKLQAKFALIVGLGILLLGGLTVALIGQFEYRSLERKLQTLSEKELNSLNWLIDSSMKMRLNDPQNVAALNRLSHERLSALGAFLLVHPGNR